MIPLLLFALAAFAASFSDAGPDAVRAHAVVPGFLDNLGSPDSLSVLLLGTPQIASLTISARGLCVDGITAHSGRVEVHAAAERITVGGRALDRAVFTAREEITIVAGKRRRVLGGIVEVRARDGRLVVVARVDQVRYLATTLCSEASMSDPAAYLVALSVLQRNYVASHRGRHAPDADVCDNTHCQLFGANGAGDPTIAGANARARAMARARAIVAEAEDLRLRGGDSVWPCYYSANCGGSSLTPADVWGRSEPGYSTVRCDECRGDRWRRWTRTVPATPIARAALSGAPRAPFVDDDFKIRVGRALGFNIVPSNTIDRLERRGSHYYISGRGFGHRVGLCQAGARQLARHGRSASQILARYFPAATVGSAATDDAGVSAMPRVGSPR